MAKPKKSGKKNTEVVSTAKVVKKRKASASDAPKMPRKRTRTEAIPVAKEAVAGKATKKQRLSVAASAQEVKPEPLVVSRRIDRGVGFVLVMGKGEFGQLGLGEDIDERKKPAAVKEMDRVVEVAAGGMHTTCLTETGEVYTFGCNDEGVLGREGEEFLPGKVDIPGKVVQISAGDSHSAALTEDGRVFLWGKFRDSHGPLEMESGPHRTPVQVMATVPAIGVSSGADHFVVLSKEGQVYTCGNPEQGQLGRIPEVFASRQSRRGKAALLTMEQVMFRRKKMQVDRTWCGEYACYMREKDRGTVFVTGLNNYSQLGSQSKTLFFQPESKTNFQGTKWDQISGGMHHTLALDSEGQVYSLGRMDYGALGVPSEPGKESIPTPTRVPVLQGIKCIEVSAGNSVSLALAENGHLYAWGSGTNYQLGQAEEVDLSEPTKVEGKQLEGCRVLSVSCGGQHVAMLAIRDPKDPKENGMEVD